MARRLSARRDAEARLGTALARTLGRRLGASLTIAATTRPLPAQFLAPEDCDRYGRLPDGPRRRQWLTGRHALAMVRARLGEDPSSSSVVFPHPRYSLTHAGRWALAVGVNDDMAGGVGIDYEPWHRLDPRTGRFFLGDRELAWIRQLPPDRADCSRLRLWTVKEAAFKACASNQDSGLFDYAVDDPRPLVGVARLTSGRVFSCAYATVVRPCGDALPGIVTVARASLDRAPVAGREQARGEPPRGLIDHVAVTMSH